MQIVATRCPPTTPEPSNGSSASAYDLLAQTGRHINGDNLRTRGILVRLNEESGAFRVDEAIGRIEGIKHPVKAERIRIAYYGIAGEWAEVQAGLAGGSIPTSKDQILAIVGSRERTPDQAGPAVRRPKSPSDRAAPNR